MLKVIVNQYEGLDTYDVHVLEVGGDLLPDEIEQGIEGVEDMLHEVSLKHQKYGSQIQGVEYALWDREGQNQIL